MLNRRLVVAAFASLLVLFTRCQTPPTDPEAPAEDAADASSAEAPVGMAARSYVDEARQNWAETGPRPLQTLVWYPAEATAVEDTIYIGPPGAPVFIPGVAARDAALADAPASYPLVVLSHGTGGSAMQLMWLGQALAAHGYIAAAVNHHGNTGAEEAPTAQGFALWWERTLDLTAVIDHLLADPQFGPRIDTTRIGAAGFSLGGYTVVSIAGGITDVQAYLDFCESPRRDATCDPQAEFPDIMEAFEAVRNEPRVQRAYEQSGASYRDHRVKAVFAIAPALGGAFTDAGLAPITIPVRIVAGQADPVAPIPTNAARFAEAIDGADLTELPGVTHYTFLSPCGPTGLQELPLLCTDPDGIDRVAIHRQVADLAAAFFDRTL